MHAVQVARRLLDLDGEIGAVFCDSKKDKSLITFAKQNGLPLFDHRALKDGSNVAEIDGIGAAVFLNVYNPSIVHADILGLFGPRAVNVHTGILPEYAGIHVHQWAIRNGDRETAATLHVMVPEIDAGDIIAETTVQISDEDTGLSLFRKVTRAGADLLIRNLPQLLSESLPPTKPQDRKRRRVYRAQDARECRTGWDLSPNQVRDFVRAGNYRPFKSPSYTATTEVLELGTIEIFEVTIGPKTSCRSGRLVGFDNGRPIVSCGEEGSVIITDAEHDGAKMTKGSWIGWRAAVGGERSFQMELS